jgi:hypothetical protein
VCSSDLPNSPKNLTAALENSLLPLFAVASNAVLEVIEDTYNNSDVSVTLTASPTSNSVRNKVFVPVTVASPEVVETVPVRAFLTSITPASSLKPKIELKYALLVDAGVKVAVQPPVVPAA